PQRRAERSRRIPAGHSGANSHAPISGIKRGIPAPGSTGKASAKFTAMVVQYEIDHGPGWPHRIHDRHGVQLGAGKPVAVRRLAGCDRGPARWDPAALVGPALDPMPDPGPARTPGRLATETRLRLSAESR